MSMGRQEFFWKFFSILLNFCQRTKPIFAILVKKGCFFVQFVYLHLKKRGVSEIFLEGYHTYKSKIICYNIISRMQKQIQNAEFRMQNSFDKKMERRKEVGKKPTEKHMKKLAEKMYYFFADYEDRGAPSFAKFARSIGFSTAELESMRSSRDFDQSYLECQKIRRDYLIDRALDKRFDSSFTKFLLSLDDEAEKSESGSFTLRLEVVDNWIWIYR